ERCPQTPFLKLSVLILPHYRAHINKVRIFHFFQVRPSFSAIIKKKEIIGSPSFYYVVIYLVAM
ncbi:MAG TPA: hypothetical protein PKI82_15125, partial [Ruminococcus flavefaciens]|nr:hypothetical protein [Ruminococcus flavefaciens]